MFSESKLAAWLSSLELHFISGTSRKMEWLSVIYDLWPPESRIKLTDTDELSFVFLTVTVAVCISTWLVLATIAPSDLGLSTLTICGLGGCYSISAQPKNCALFHKAMKLST